MLYEHEAEWQVRWTEYRGGRVRKAAFCLEDAAEGVYDALVDARCNTVSFWGKVGGRWEMIRGVAVGRCP
jgi:hypothetical protein